MKGNHWYQRILREAKKISPHIRFKPIRYGFVRIYYKNAYIGECYKEMPQIGHDIEEKNFHREDRTYLQQFEETIDSTARLKNFREGYWETLDRLRTRTFMVKHDKEFYEKARKGYSQMRIK